MTTTILDPHTHARLIADEAHFCQVAGIQTRFLHESMVKYCGPIEIEWVKKFRHYQTEGIAGLLLIGMPHPEIRCQAIAAALLRNFVDARVVPVGGLLEGEPPSPTVLLIPNLFTEIMGKALAPWHVQRVYDLLLDRFTHSKPSVLYLDSLAGFGEAYGLPFLNFLEQFKKVDVLMDEGAA